MDSSVRKALLFCKPGSCLVEFYMDLYYSGGKYAKVKIEWMDDRWKVVNVQHILDY